MSEIPNYEIGDDISFRFHTLAEVGDPYQPKFRDMIKEKGWVVEHSRQLDYYPWVADFITGMRDGYTDKYCTEVVSHWVEREV